MPASTPTIYLVEDDDAVRESLRALLECHGMAVEEYETGTGFLSNCRSDSRGCVVLDMHLPKVSGLETLMRLRQELHSTLPVVMMTGQTDRGLRDKLIAAGATHYVEKPFDGEALVATLSVLAST